MSPMAQTLTSHGDFRLSSIKKLVIWIVDSATQEFWCRLIRRSTVLHDLEINGVYDINRFVATLIDISPITNLGFSNVVRHATMAIIKTSLIPLFERYAQISNNATVKSASSLEMIILRYCDDINDELFTSLENVSTLHGIWLGGLRDITSIGIKQFISNISNRLTCVRFEDLIQVDNTTIIALGGMEKLMSVKLQRLPNVTDQGVRGLVETKNNRNSTSVLNKLVVKQCPMISNQCIQFVKGKVKAVEYSS